jgi:hypothetical protein
LAGKLGDCDRCVSAQKPREELVDGGDGLEAANRLEEFERVVRATKLDVDNRIAALGA